MSKTNTAIKGLDIYKIVPKDHNGIPFMKKCNRLPSGLVPFVELGKRPVPDGHAVHFFLHDQQFECVWNQYIRYTKVLSKYKFLLSPDFSAYMDMPDELINYNVWRSRLLGSWWQMNGNDVIPTITWAGVASYDKCFSGVESGGVVAVGACHVRDKCAANLWRAGFYEMIDRLRPSNIVMYGCGTPPALDVHVNVMTFMNPFIERMRRANGRNG